MVTRSLRCPECGHTCERTRLGMKEPPLNCGFCDAEMVRMPTYPSGEILRGAGFHRNDYPKSAEQLIKDYGLERHDSTNPNSDYHEEGYDGT